MGTFYVCRKRRHIECLMFWDPSWVTVSADLMRLVSGSREHCEVPEVSKVHM